MTMQHHTVDDVDRQVELVFDAPSPSRRNRRWALGTAIVAVLLVAGLIASSVAGGSPSQSLRTASAELHDVDAELRSVATIEPVSQAAVAFPASGTVAAVDVAVGDPVVVGQTLASLDTVQLTRTLNQANATLADAELALSRALDGESTSDGPTVEPAGFSSSTGGEVVLLSTSQQPSAGGTDAQQSTAGGTDAELAALQQAVLDGQAAVDRAITASNAAMATARNVCGTEGEPAAGGSTPAASLDDTGLDDTGLEQIGSNESTTDTAACLAALGAVQDAQAETAVAQQQLAVASTALDDHRAEVAAQSSVQSGSSSGAASGSASGEAPSSDATGGAASTTSSSPSAAELVAYQKTVSAAELGVLVAQQAIQQATIVAPIDGTVVAVGFAAADEVTAASATQTVTIQGDGGVEVVTTVALSDIASVEVGQPAAVSPDGSTEVLQGEVVAVAATPDGSTTTSFRVTVGLTDVPTDLGVGTTGSVAIVTGQAEQALAVPSSAITWTGGNATVQVVSGDAVEQTAVEIGVTGGDWIEVVSGIDEGAEVVLADLDEPVPGADSDATTDDATADSPLAGTARNAAAAGFGPPGG